MKGMKILFDFYYLLSDFIIWYRKNYSVSVNTEYAIYLKFYFFLENEKLLFGKIRKIIVTKNINEYTIRL